MNGMKQVVFLWMGFMIIAGCSSSQKNSQVSDGLPPIEREFRAAWVATVANINWPSRPGLPVDSQKIQAIAILDSMKSMRMNAVLFQARPQADALYASELEPWSYFLSGEQGKAPEPFYDPLQFWIDAAHERGLDLHVWVNPYRAHHTAGGPISEFSVVNRFPEVVHELSSGYYWFEPTHPITQNHSYAVVMDILKRYDVDGIHMDDYFYPYPSYHDEDFPDEKSYQQYLKSGGKLSKGDWRRDAVNAFVERLYKGIKKEKPWVQFGVSPFGIWRPGNPPSIQGFDQYDKLYADVKLWLEQGWMDYLAPQLYWPINQVPQSFPVLLGWWDEVNPKRRHVWPGVSVARFEGEKRVDETINQIMITRGMLKDAPGLIHWSIAPHMKDSALVEALKKGPYRKQALIPASPWFDKKAPDSPTVKHSTEMGNWITTWTHPEKEKLSKVIVFTEYAGKWEYSIQPVTDEPLTFLLQREIPVQSVDSLSESMPIVEVLTQVKLKVVDRAGNISVASR
jgi:uncharacterized lipoprotein YddW (UPF0748 family)